MTVNRSRSLCGNSMGRRLIILSHVRLVAFAGSWVIRFFGSKRIESEWVLVIVSSHKLIGIHLRFCSVLFHISYSYFLDHQDAERCRVFSILQSSAQIMAGMINSIWPKSLATSRISAFSCWRQVYQYRGSTTNPSHIESDSSLTASLLTGSICIRICAQSSTFRETWRWQLQLLIFLRHLRVSYNQKMSESQTLVQSQSVRKLHPDTRFFAHLYTWNPCEAFFVGWANKVVHTSMRLSKTICSWNNLVF